MKVDSYKIENIFNKHSFDFYPIVPFDKNKDKIVPVDISINNPAFTESTYCNAEALIAFFDKERKRQHAKYLLGGYKEQRQMYRRSHLFDQNLIDNITAEEPRSLHLGVDIWGKAGTPVSAPLGGMIHSFAFNNHFGDYGATIILQHQLDTINFYTLYGHLSLKDLDHKRQGQFITRGETFCHFGEWDENGNWPAHLHFQVILDIGIFHGDYPGVCKMSEAGKYLKNCPDPNLLIKL